MPQSNNPRIRKLLALLVVALLTLLLLAALVGFFILRISSDTNPVGTRANSSLRFVIIATRHGDRSPLFSFPTNPYLPEDTKFWPFGPSQLTARGRVQLYNLGKLVRTIYNGFLNESYHQHEFQAYSTPKDRTLMSAQAFLAGLFPPKGFQVWNDQLLWQPVPVFTTTLDHFQKALEKMDAKFRQENEADMTSVFEYAKPYTGLTSREDMPIVLYDPITCAKKEGLPLPSWTNKIFPEPLTSLMDSLELFYTSVSTEVMRLLEGQLYQEMVGLMQAKANDSLKPDRKMYIYSVHDITIRTLRAMLGNRLEMVNTGSALVFELHRFSNSTEHFVEVQYIDGGKAPLAIKTVTIPGCAPPCPLSVLMDITKEYYDIADYEKECHATDEA